MINLLFKRLFDSPLESPLGMRFITIPYLLLYPCPVLDNNVDMGAKDNNEDMEEGRMKAKPRATMMRSRMRGKKWRRSNGRRVEAWTSRRTPTSGPTRDPAGGRQDSTPMDIIIIARYCGREKSPI